MPEVLHLDDALVAIAKPAGRIVIPGRGSAAAEPSLRDEIGAELGRRLFVLHRLDRGTSGVLLFALERQRERAVPGHDALPISSIVPWHRALSLAFERHQVDKRYWALCQGTML